MKKTKIYVFGNPLLSFDNLALKLIPELKKKFPNFDFIASDPNENIGPENKELIIIDIVENINKVMIFNDLDKIKTGKIYSAHDFDLAFNLKLLQKIGKLNKVTIFAIPVKIKKQQAFNQLSCLMKDYFKIKSS